jgi:hypothetical protein
VPALGAGVENGGLGLCHGPSSLGLAPDTALRQLCANSATSAAGLSSGLVLSVANTTGVRRR